MLDTIRQRLPVTARLTLVAVLFEIVIGITAGVLAGIRRNSFFDNLVLVSTTHHRLDPDPGARLRVASTCSG